MATFALNKSTVVSLKSLADNLSFLEEPKAISSLNWRWNLRKCPFSGSGSHSRTPFPKACASANESQGSALSFQEYTQKINGIVKSEASGNGSAVKNDLTKNSPTKSPDPMLVRVPQPLFYHQGGLIDGGLGYREKFIIRCYEVGMNRTASIETIANLLQEIGVNHARSVGFSNDGFATTPLMREQKLIWVTTRMHIEMDKYPMWGDVVVIDTWFQNVSNIFSRRDWIIRLDHSNEVIGRGTSSWVMMNEETRKLSRIPANVKAEYANLCPHPPRFALENESNEKIEEISDSAQFLCKSLMPRRGDLDMNQHVNNVTYIAWMLSSLPSTLFEEAELAKITIEYKQECRSGDCVDSMASISDRNPTLPNHQPPSIPDGGYAPDEFTLSPSQTQHIKFTHLLQFNSDSKEGLNKARNKREINRGRTVWRVKANCSI